MRIRRALESVNLDAVTHSPAWTSYPNHTRFKRGYRIRNRCSTRLPQQEAAFQRTQAEHEHRLKSGFSLELEALIERLREQLSSEADVREQLQAWAYGILHLAWGATASEIKQRYKRLSMALHPE